MLWVMYLVEGGIKVAQFYDVQEAMRISDKMLMVFQHTITLSTN